MKNRVIYFFVGVVLLMSSVVIYFSVAVNRRSVSTSEPVNIATSFPLEPIFTFKPFLNTVNLITYTDPNRSVLISKDDGTDARVVYTPALPDGAPHGFTWSPDGKRLAFFESRTGDSNKRILFIDLGQGKVYLFRSLLRNHSSQAAWSPASDQIALAEIKDIDSRAGRYVGSLYVVDLQTMSSSANLPYFTLPGVDTLPGIVRWVADGVYYVSRGKLVKFDPRQRSITPVVDVANKSVTAFAISAVSQKLVYALPTGEVYLRDLSQSNSSALLVDDLSPEIDYAEELAFSPNGNYVAGYATPNRNFYFNINDNDKSIKYFPGHLSWSASSGYKVDEYNGKVILHSEDGDSFLFDANTNIIKSVTNERLLGVHN